MKTIYMKLNSFMLAAVCGVLLVSTLASASALADNSNPPARSVPAPTEPAQVNPCTKEELGRQGAAIIVDTLVSVNDRGTYIDPERSKREAYFTTLYPRNPIVLDMIVSVVMHSKRGNVYELGVFTADLSKCMAHTNGFSAATDLKGSPWIKPGTVRN